MKGALVMRRLFFWERAMHSRRSLCAAALFYGLGLVALVFSGGCGESGTEGVRAAPEGQLKEQSVKHGKRMMEYYKEKNANKAAVKGQAR
jgi:hypothetical protein